MGLLFRWCGVWKELLQRLVCYKVDFISSFLILITTCRHQPWRITKRHTARVSHNIILFLTPFSCFFSLMFCSISTTILHKPLHALVDLICSLHTRGEPNNETQQRKKEKEPHIAPVKRRSPSNRLTLASILLIYVSFYFLNFFNFCLQQ